jgi:SAM-dependent methyltransferase
MLGYSKTVIGYQDDLAYIHDSGFGDFAREAAPSLLAILRRNGIRNGLVVDLGCGSGIWGGILLDQGYEVLGIDISSAMIRLARRRAPGAKFLVASLFDVPLPFCRAVTVVSEALNYTFDRRNESALIARFFRRVFAALEPGGVLLLDFAEPGQVARGAVRQSFWDAEDWAVLLEARENHARRTLTREITSFRRSGKLFRRRDETHELRLYEAKAITAELERIGFAVTAHKAWGRWILPPAHSALIARKPRASVG